MGAGRGVALNIPGLRLYLRDWARWVRSWKPGLGYPHAVPYIDGRLPMVPPGYADEGDCATETEERIEIFAMRLIDTGIQNLPKDQCYAIRNRYLLEADSSVWRCGPTALRSLQTCADQAEETLARFVVARGLQL